MSSAMSFMNNKNNRGRGLTLGEHQLLNHLTQISLICKLRQVKDSNYSLTHHLKANVTTMFQEIQVLFFILKQAFDVVYHST